MYGHDDDNWHITRYLVRDNVIHLFLKFCRVNNRDRTNVWGILAESGSGPSRHQDIITAVRAWHEASDEQRHSRTLHIMRGRQPVSIKGAESALLCRIYLRQICYLATRCSVLCHCVAERRQLYSCMMTCHYFNVSMGDIYIYTEGTQL